MHKADWDEFTVQRTSLICQGGGVKAIKKKCKEAIQLLQYLNISQ